MSPRYTVSTSPIVRPEVNNRSTSSSRCVSVSATSTLPSACGVERIPGPGLPVKPAAGLAAETEATLEAASNVLANGYLRLDPQEWVRAVEKRRSALGG